jgi:hypothetical protein
MSQVAGTCECGNEPLGYYNIFEFCLLNGLILANVEIHTLFLKMTWPKF